MYLPQFHKLEILEFKLLSALLYVGLIYVLEDYHGISVFVHDLFKFLCAAILMPVHFYVVSMHRSFDFFSFQHYICLGI